MEVVSNCGRWYQSNDAVIVPSLYSTLPSTQKATRRQDETNRQPTPRHQTRNRYDGSIGIGLYHRPIRRRHPVLTDVVTSALGVGNIALYAGAYTYLKPRSEWNTWVGAVVGAIPPVMGYTAATQGQGLLDVEAVLLGTTLFLWQFPHFMALSWMHRVDYARGGFEMVATNDSVRGDATARLVMNYTYYLSAMPVVATLTGVTSSMFAIEGLALNGYALYVARNFDKDRSNRNARKVFLTCLWYLPCWMVLFLLHSKNWKENTDSKEIMKTDDDIVSYLKKKASEIRSKGKELCVHEVAYDDAEHSGTCPIVLGKSQAKNVEITINNVVETSSIKMEGNVKAP